MASAGDEAFAGVSLEKILEKLSGVVEKLERGDVPLEQALGMFEEGVKLAREGQRRLDAAEARIEALAADGSTATISVASVARDGAGPGST
ncbi:MAG: exodeoxyribonuclease VII small subunit [Polyangiales bacterium]